MKKKQQEPMPQGCRKCNGNPWIVDNSWALLTSCDQEANRRNCSAPLRECLAEMYAKCGDNRTVGKSARSIRRHRAVLQFKCPFRLQKQAAALTALLPLLQQFCKR
jgi:hypothetical protein